jgi:ATP-dependent DNA helicase HFM1/MER3
MAMGRLFQNALDSLNRSISHKRYDSHSNIPNHRKIVYLSPSKALCQERYNDWSRRLSQINPTIECAMITGDSSESNGSIRDVASAHVILTTPEKWDSITRKWTDHLYLIGSVKLLLVDEVHLIGDKSRGACLEAIICRMKTVQRAAKARNGIAHHSSEDEERLSR